MMFYQMSVSLLNDIHECRYGIILHSGRGVVVTPEVV